MLGEDISDPENSEGGGSIRGMGLLKAKTVFSCEKTRSRTSGKFSDITGVFSALSGLPFSGYEIHMGETQTAEQRLLTCGGAISENVGNVCGCYIHGIFDSDEVSAAIVRMLCDRRGVKFSEAAESRDEFKRRQFDILADAARENLDIELICRIVGIK